MASVLFGDFSNDAVVILTETIVIEGGREMFRSSTVSLIDANAIPPRLPGFLREPPHVVRFYASLEPMDDQHGRVFGGRGLPMAFCEEADLRSDLKNSILGKHPGRKAAARPPSRDKGHAVRALKPRVWNERWNSHRAMSSMGEGDRANDGGSFFYYGGYQKSWVRDKGG